MRLILQFKEDASSDGTMIADGAMVQMRFFTVSDVIYPERYSVWAI